MKLRLSQKDAVRHFLAVLYCCACISAARGEVTFTVLHSFTGGDDGAYPSAGLVQGPDKKLYGTATYGGSYGKGVVFALSSDGSVSNIVTFDGANGAYPHAALFRSRNGDWGTGGDLYGTTSSGGAHFGGTVFRIGRSGAFSNIVQLASWDGGSVAPVIEDHFGNLFGTTPDSGPAPFGEHGTVFEIKRSGEFNTLLAFSETNGDGRGPGPQCGLVLGRDRDFYGTCIYGGTNGTPLTYAEEDGMIFKMTPGGEESVVASFNWVNGAFPVASLTLGTNGDFYGTTEGGGDYSWGTVFHLTADGSIVPLYSFTGNDDGGNPQSELVKGEDGNFYGTTMQGGTNDAGVIYQISPDGQFSTIYQFTGGTDGQGPVAGLLQGKDGSYYGTTQYGGQFGMGVIFRISLAP